MKKTKKTRKTSLWAYFFGGMDVPEFDWGVEFKWRQLDAIYDIKDPETYGTWTIDSKKKTIAYRVESSEEKCKRDKDWNYEYNRSDRERNRIKSLTNNAHKLILSSYERAIEEKKQKAKLRIEIKDIVLDVIKDLVV